MKNILIFVSVLVLFGCYYEPTVYRVHYHADDATSGKPPVDSNTYGWGESVKILEKGNLENNDYLFLGWRYNNQRYIPGEYITVNFDDINLYALWDDGTDIPFTFVIENDGVKITGVKMSFSDRLLTIQDTIQGKPVTEIDNSVFSNSLLTGLNLPKYLKHIGVWAFSSNSLTQLIIPDSVKTMGAAAFQNNKIRKVAFGTGLSAIAAMAFRNNNLENIIIPDNITSIGEGAFLDNNINMITMPANVNILNDTSLGDYGASFKTFYNTTGKKAGFYQYAGSDTWVKLE